MELRGVMNVTVHTGAGEKAGKEISGRSGLADFSALIRIQVKHKEPRMPHTIPLPAGKRIALVAHDDRKQDLLDWARTNREHLKDHVLCGTGTTGTLLKEALDLDVTAYMSGPLGDDQQIGAKIAQGEIDVLIFFWDPLNHTLTIPTCGRCCASPCCKISPWR